MLLKTVSTPKKNTASRLVMITTMIAVITVSLRVGQTILADSERTCRRNSPGLTLAMLLALLLALRRPCIALGRISLRERGTKPPPGRFGPAPLLHAVG